MKFILLVLLIIPFISMGQTIDSVYYTPLKFEFNNTTLPQYNVFGGDDLFFEINPLESRISNRGTRISTTTYIMYNVHPNFEVGTIGQLSYRGNVVQPSINMLFIFRLNYWKKPHKKISF